MAATIAEAWKTLEAAITAYTGLSPAAFFTTMAVAAAIYYAVASCFAAPPPPRRREVDFPTGEPLQPPVQLGEVTEEELRQYDGSDPKKPLLMAIKGQIYDVSQSRMFYGPGGPYALFAGKDASRALAKMSFEEKDLTGDISGLGPFELDALQDWEYKFMGKYNKVGTIKSPAAPVDGDSTFNAAEATLASTASDSAEPREIGGLDAANPAEPTKTREAGDQEDANPAEPRDVDDHKDAANPAEPRAVHNDATRELKEADVLHNDATRELKEADVLHNDAARELKEADVLHNDAARELKEADVLHNDATGELREADVLNNHAPEPDNSESKSEATKD